MKKNDEMDRNIRLHSESIGFKVVLSALAIWSLYELWNYWWGSGVRNILPITLTIVGALTQQFSMRAIKQRMVAGDEEYKESNKLLRIIISAVVVLAILLSVGAYLMSLGK